ncbi:MAG: arsenate reductase ArsC [Methanomicrobium sp.]|nr:arsenate reductase ArsC [Methanomicrobium sp.]MDD4300227.1 arsenate reductase ArsC [Methanomicrobium sp.]
MTERKKVLFICNHNAGRSQMAEAVLNSRYNEKYEAFSAGINPSAEINKNTALALESIGADISDKKPKSTDVFLDTVFDIVVLMCECGVKSQKIPKHKQLIKKEFADPYLFFGSKTKIQNGFQSLLKEISEWIDETFGREESIRRTVRVLLLKNPDGTGIVPICSDTQRHPGDVASDMNKILSKEDISVVYEEREAQIPKNLSYLLTVDDKTLEELVPLPDPSKYCGMSCDSCGGTASGQGCTGMYTEIPESVLRLAIKKAASAPAGQKKLFF